MSHDVQSGKKKNTTYRFFFFKSLSKSPINSEANDCICSTFSMTSGLNILTKRLNENDKLKIVLK